MTTFVPSAIFFLSMAFLFGASAEPLKDPGDCVCSRTQGLDAPVFWIWTPSNPDTGKDGACDEALCQTPIAQCEWDGVLKWTPTGNSVITLPGGATFAWPGYQVLSIRVDINAKCGKSAVYKGAVNGVTESFTFTCGVCARTSDN